MEGYLEKRGAIFKTWRRRFFRVLEGNLLYYANKQVACQKGPPKGSITLDEAVLCIFPEPQFKKLHAFGVTPKSWSRTYVLVADSNETRRKWLKYLTEFGARPDSTVSKELGLHQKNKSAEKIAAVVDTVEEIKEQSRSAAPKATEPKAPAPATEPKATEPKTPAPATEPKATEPKATEPKAPAPATEPKATEPKAPEPKEALATPTEAESTPQSTPTVTPEAAQEAAPDQSETQAEQKESDEDSDDAGGDVPEGYGGYNEVQDADLAGIQAEVQAAPGPDDEEEKKGSDSDSEAGDMTGYGAYAEVDDDEVDAIAYDTYDAYSSDEDQGEADPDQRAQERQARVDEYVAHREGMVAREGDDSETTTTGTGDVPEEEKVVSPFINVPEVHSAKRDWNEEFQALWELPNNTAEEKLQRAVKIFSFFNEFAHMARTLGKIIIAETHLPTYAKAIKPADVGGIAGGEKFFAGGIFFKRVCDPHNLYGGDEGAMRAAGQELKGLKAYLRSGVQGLRMALMCLIDCRGTRLSASCMLPLGKDTLQYGSDDAGKSVMCHPQIAPLMEQAASVLNLKKHIVGRPPVQVELCGPVDIEVHIGKDDRFYVLDTARVFPPARKRKVMLAAKIPMSSKDVVEPLELSSNGWRPQVCKKLGTEKVSFGVCRLSGMSNGVLCTAARPLPIIDGKDHPETRDGQPYNPNASRLCNLHVYGDCVWIATPKGEWLYQLLREEYVRSYKCPLSSDAFSTFGMHNHKEHNAEVQEATDNLLNNVIPEFTKQLLKSPPQDSEELRKSMGRAGINMRYAGLIRRRIINDDQKADENHLKYAGHAPLTMDSLHKARLRTLLLTDMVSRFAKNSMREQLRGVVAVEDEGFYPTILNYFNRIFGVGPAAEHFWKVEVIVGLTAKYGLVFDKYDNYNVNTDVRAYVHMPTLLLLLQKTTGIRLQRQTNIDYTSQAINNFLTEAPFKMEDIVSIDASVSRLYWDTADMLIEVDHFMEDKTGLSSSKIGSPDVESKQLLEAANIYSNYMDTGLSTYDPLFGERGRLFRAEALLANGQPEEAWDMVDKPWKSLKRRLYLPSALLAGVHFLRGRILEARGDELAKKEGTFGVSLKECPEMLAQVKEEEAKKNPQYDESKVNDFWYGEEQGKEHSEDVVEFYKDACTEYMAAMEFIQKVFGKASETIYLGTGGTDIYSDLSRHTTVKKGHPIQIIIVNAICRIQIRKRCHTQRDQWAMMNVQQTSHDIISAFAPPREVMRKKDLMQYYFGELKFSLCTMTGRQARSLDYHTYMSSTFKSGKPLPVDTWMSQVNSFYDVANLPGGFQVSADGDHVYDKVDGFTEAEGAEPEIKAEPGSMLELEEFKGDLKDTIFDVDKYSFTIPMPCAVCGSEGPCEHGIMGLSRQKLHTFVDTETSSASMQSHTGSILSKTYNRQVLLGRVKDPVTQQDKIEVANVSYSSPEDYKEGKINHCSKNDQPVTLMTPPAVIEKEKHRIVYVGKEAIPVYSGNAGQRIENPAYIMDNFSYMPVDLEGKPIAAVSTRFGMEMSYTGNVVKPTKSLMYIKDIGVTYEHEVEVQLPENGDTSSPGPYPIKKVKVEHKGYITRNDTTGHSDGYSENHNYPKFSPVGYLFMKTHYPTSDSDNRIVRFGVLSPEEVEDIQKRIAEKSS